MCSNKEDFIQYYWKLVENALLVACWAIRVKCTDPSHLSFYYWNNGYVFFEWYCRTVNLHVCGAIDCWNIIFECEGRLLIAVYHIVAIIVVLNMLIAMMSKSYEITSENEEREWLFHRTNLWIRHIRGDAILPPPMNLIPNPYWLFSALKEKICCCFSKGLGKGQSLPLSNYFSGESSQIVSNTETKICSQRREVLMDLVKRYKFKHLLNDL